MNSIILEIHVEEKSMEIFLRGVLPRILPEEYILDVNCRIVTYNGKQDLKKKLPIVIRSYLRRAENNSSSSFRNFRLGICKLVC